ncbi:MAG: hypothetical protein QNJ30_26855 [Kiloniellales bacterium]|nr:hypothetical protein [Kiloniellales bacterium]
MTDLTELKDRKQAVIVIHGIGDQRPMETLRGFLEAVLTESDKSYLPKYWSKPDEFSKSFELRRCSAPRRRDRPRTDFFEFYWQHLMQGNRVSHVRRWVLSLLFRRPSKAPSQLRPLWWLSWIVVLAAAVLLSAGGVARYLEAGGLAWLMPALGAVGLVLQGFLLTHVADAARYLDPSPANVPARQKIRSAGVDLLAELHERGDYNRIVVVGHSLGSVIGYDILYHFWTARHARHASPETPKHDALKALEALARAQRADPAAARDEIAAAQRAYGFELLENGHAWLVTDFVTLGSPLAHAELLLARDAADFRARQRQRELPSCLPFLEYGKVFSFKQGYDVEVRADGKAVTQERTLRVPHHAAVFAPVRWTNLYFPSRFFIDGDLIGGPLADTTAPASRRFGAAIRDVPLRTKAAFGLFSHTRYWRLHEADAALENAPVPALRAALALDDKPVWEAYLTAAQAPPAGASRPARKRA